MLLAVANSVESVGQFLAVLLIFLFVLAITYFTTRYLAGIQKGRMKTANMELMETLRISNSQYLQIVRVGQRYLCMAVCKDSVTLLSELTEEELDITEAGGTPSVPNFQDIFEKVKNRQPGSRKNDTNEDK